MFIRRYQMSAVLSVDQIEDPNGALKRMSAVLPVDQIEDFLLACAGEKVRPSAV
jgi:hypothetical protein